MRWLQVSSRSEERPDLKAYHVYVVNDARDPAVDTATRTLELITHMYSCLTHKEFNPDIPLVLIADDRTVDYFDHWNITSLYDEIVTDILDDYPRHRVSRRFWASPKIWAMSKLLTPFVIFDTDLVLQKPLVDFFDCDLLYLHRELSGPYPNIFDVEGPPSFVWDEEIRKSFSNCLPMNCALIGMFNEAFKSDYVTAYFNYVLDSTGELQYANRNSQRMTPENSAQIMIEQWFIAALVEYWRRIGGREITTKSYSRVISCDDYFMPYDPDLPANSVDAELDYTFYHLWGAKKYQNDRSNPFFQKARSTLIGATRIVENSPYRDVLREPFGALIAELH